jgi:hypothetical protein
LATKDALFLNYKKVANVLTEDIPVIPANSEPSSSNNGGKAMDLDISDPAEKARQAEKDNAVNIANIALAPWKENDYLCKNLILCKLSLHLH